VTVGADKGYDIRDFVAKTRALAVTPHVAQNVSGRKSAIDGRTTRHEGYTVSRMFVFAAAAYNLVRMRKSLGSHVTREWAAIRKTRRVVCQASVILLRAPIMAAVRSLERK
jgi:hypothetical protein